jgi:hypothetical protein
VPPLERILLPRLAYAQTVVNGSPVPGAVVCASEQDKDLVPFARCTNTGSDGKATFFFIPPTTAGAYISKINGTLTTNGVVEATTFDTAKATVVPGPVNPNFSSLAYFGGLGLTPSPARFPKNGLVDVYNNAVPYRIPADALITPQDTVLGSEGAHTVTFAKLDSTYHVVALTGDQGAVIAHLRYRIVSDNGTLKIDWDSYGLGRPGP